MCARFLEGRVWLGRDRSSQARVPDRPGLHSEEAWVGGWQASSVRRLYCRTRVAAHRRSSSFDGLPAELSGAEGPVEGQASGPVGCVSALSSCALIISSLEPGSSVPLRPCPVLPPAAARTVPARCNHLARTRTWAVGRRHVPGRTRWTAVWIRHDRSLWDLALTIPPARPVAAGPGDVQTTSRLQGVGRPLLARPGLDRIWRPASFACPPPVYRGSTCPREAARRVACLPRPRDSGIAAGCQVEGVPSTGVRRPALVGPIRGLPVLLSRRSPPPTGPVSGDGRSGLEEMRRRGFSDRQAAGPLPGSPCPSSRAPAPRQAKSRTHPLPHHRPSGFAPGRRSRATDRAIPGVPSRARTGLSIALAGWQSCGV
jgi:hypothetical protein